MRDLRLSDVERTLLFGTTKAWPDLARERSLETRRQNAKKKKPERDRKKKEDAAREGVRNRKLGDYVGGIRVFSKGSPERGSSVRDALRMIPLKAHEVVFSSGSLRGIRVHNPADLADVRAYDNEVDQKGIGTLESGAEIAPLGWYENGTGNIQIGYTVSDAGLFATGMIENIEFVVLHEFGHALAKSFHAARNKGNAEATRFMENFQEAVEASKFAPSAYAAMSSSLDEHFAESFRVMLQAPIPTKNHAPEVFRVLDDFFKGKYQWWKIPAYEQTELGLKSRKKAWTDAARERSLEVRRRNRKQRSKLKDTRKRLHTPEMRQESQQLWKTITSSVSAHGPQPALAEMSKLAGRISPNFLRAIKDHGKISSVRAFGTYGKWFNFLAKEVGLEILLTMNPLGMYNSGSNQLVMTFDDRSWSMSDPSMEKAAVLLHEMGHAVFDVLNDLDGMSDNWNNKFGMLLREFQFKVMDSGADITPYAASFNTDLNDGLTEHFAEAFRMYLGAGKDAHRILQMRYSSTYAFFDKLAKSDDWW